jgi:hypothetical protein
VEIGQLDYEGDTMNDASMFNVSVGAGKRFYPKSSVEATVTYLSQTHDNNGEEFGGVVYKIMGKHITTSGQSSFHLILGSKVIPSSILGTDYIETMYVRYGSRHNITTKIEAQAYLTWQNETIADDRTDSILEIVLKGSYTPKDILPPKYIRRRQRKMPRKRSPRFKIDAGVRSRSRTSDLPGYDFNQLVIFAGCSIVY